MLTPYIKLLIFGWINNKSKKIQLRDNNSLQTDLKSAVNEEPTVRTLPDIRLGSFSASTQA
jgi:hypothetical protein